MLSPSEAEQRFLARISRRIKLIESLSLSGLAIYLPPETDQRLKAAEKFVRLNTYAEEFPHLTDQQIKEVAAKVLAALEEGQRLLPHDVQHLNRIRRAW